MLYYRSRVVGGIYDDRPPVKPVKSAVAYMRDPSYELPCDGAKEMLLLDDVDDKEHLAGQFNAVLDELPEPKAEKKK